MFVVEIIPLRRGIQVDTLTYFSSEPYDSGNIVHIPLRNKTLPGVIASCNQVSATKAALRAATFSLRKLPAQENVKTLSPAFIKSAREISDYYAANIGSVLFNMLSPAIRSGEIPLPHTHHTDAEPVTPEVLIGNKKERFLAYRSLVREVFAHSGSVLAVTPTAAEAEELFELLSPGIEDRIVMLTGTLTKKQLHNSYEALQNFNKSKLIIATSQYAVLERHDITLTILEHSRSPFYKERVRPYLDYRDVLRVHAKHTGRRLLFGDLLVRSDEEFYRREEIYHTYEESPRRIELPGKLEVIEMQDTPDGSVPFKLFSETALRAIRDTKKAKGHVFLFAARRGLAPVVACLDCGYIFRSPESGAPYSLVRIMKHGKEERWFMCGASGQKVRAHDTCVECGSWRLRERGIGIQHVYDELVKLMPETPIIQFDHTSASTFKKARFLRDKFLGTKGSIMIGTPMSLPYLNKQIDTTIVVNMDALYATPTWRLQEENFALLLRLREQTSGTVFIQTRTKDDSLIKEARHGTIEQFYTEELELRKTFNYPPFTTFIHLTWQGSKDSTKKIRGEIEKMLQGYAVNFYGTPPSPKGVYVEYGLLRVASKDWPIPDLVKRLRSLSPVIRIVINPDKII